jgi:hypothetical protein
MKKCPPGVICIENVTLFILFIVIMILSYLVYYYLLPKDNNHKQKNDSREHVVKSNNSFFNVPFLNVPFLNVPFNNVPYLPPPVPGDVLLNPYIPPLRDERYLVPSLNYIPPGAVPINISTNVGAVDTNYRQVGILTPLNSSSKDSILPLMGRPLFTNRDKWQYYTISNQHNNVKLPVSKGGRSCTNEYGCDKIYNGDSIYIEGVNDAYKVTIYDNDVIKYLPFV